MNNNERTALKSVVITILAVVLIALVIAGIFFNAGQERSAYQLFVKVLATAVPWLIIIIGLLLLYKLGTHKARRREELELNSFPFLMTPAIGSWLIPIPFILLCAVVWFASLMFKGDRTLWQLFTDNGPAQSVMLTVACISGVSGILFLAYLFSLRIAYSTNAIRVSRFLRKPCVFRWSDMTQIVLRSNQYAPVIGITFYTHTGHVHVSCALLNPDDWDDFYIKMCETAQMYSVPIGRENINSKW